MKFINQVKKVKFLYLHAIFFRYICVKKFIEILIE